jgi:hypothetical protein
MNIALSALGYSVRGSLSEVWQQSDGRAIYAAADQFLNSHQFDALEDTPWFVMYQYLDEKYPGSKFILTIRDSQSWLRSQERRWGKDGEAYPLHAWIYGHASTYGHEDEYIAKFEQHIQDVVAYFQDRPKDLLILDLTKEAEVAWLRICRFLDIDTVPSTPFPHQNKKK